MNKQRIRTHLKKFEIAYTMLVFWIGVLGLLALEARGVIS